MIYRTRIKGEIMTLLVDKEIPPDSSAVHVLIVAVGEYPHLADGKGDRFEDPAGMTQLDSPPFTAYQLCEWMRNEFVPYQSALGTVDVLCSGAQQFYGVDGKPVQVEAATLKNVEAAVQAWFLRGNSREDNTLIFYFCGHGVSSGEVHSLLLQDFGGNAFNPFGDAIDAGAMVDGMRRCTATKQLFLFDACRTMSREYLLKYGSNGGVPIISGAANGNLGASRQVCLWASELGRPAYGRIGCATVFADGLMAALEGAAARRDVKTFDWVIEAHSLQEGINTFIGHSIGSDKQYVTPGRMTMGFPLHVLREEPIVPVYVVCRPEERLQAIELACNPGDKRNIGAPWLLRLRYGQYQLTATEIANGSLIRTEKCWAAPPTTIVPMEV